MSDEARRLAELAGKREDGRNVRVKRGTVEEISLHEYSVLVDGDDEAIDIPAACEASVGDRVVIICDGTVWAVIAAYR